MKNEIPSRNPDMVDSKRFIRGQHLLMNVSLTVGFFMLVGKWYAYLLTGSAAILSDAAESVVHVIAVAFAAYSLRLSYKPADRSHPYGHDRISFFSAGVEGAMIILAALTIMYEAVGKWMSGLELTNLGEGTLLVAAAGIVNGALGGFLVWQGKRHASMILTANGKHVLTDSWTSAGVIIGLLLVQGTGWKPFDPLLALVVALNILWSGGKLIRQSVGGLMDEGDPDLEKKIRRMLDTETAQRDLMYHEFRYRNAGNRLWVEFHLLFPKGTPVEEAHWMATEIEATVTSSFAFPVNIITHLEPLEGHDSAHRKLKATKE